VVGDDHAGNACRLQGQCIVGMEHALDPDGQAGLRHQPGEVGPGGRGPHQALEDAAAVLPRFGRDPGGQVGRHAVGRHAKARPQSAVAGDLQRGVERNDDGAVARLFGARHQGRGVAAAWLEIQLEPLVRARRQRHVFQRAGGQGAAHHAAVGGGSRARAADFGGGMRQGLERDRRQQDGVGQ
jgi:hypothetical protein